MRVAAYIAEHGGLATELELQVLLGLHPMQPVAGMLKGAVASGRLIKSGRSWRIGQQSSLVNK